MFRSSYHASDINRYPTAADAQAAVDAAERRDGGIVGILPVYRRPQLRYPELRRRPLVLQATTTQEPTS